MRKVELTFKEGKDCDAEIKRLTKKKLPNLLKIELSELLMKLAVRFKASQEVLDEIFKEHGKVKEGLVQIDLFDETDPLKLKKTPEYEQVLEIHDRKLEPIEFELAFSLFDKVEQDDDFYPQLYKFIDKEK